VAGWPSKEGGNKLAVIRMVAAAAAVEHTISIGRSGHMATTGVVRAPIKVVAAIATIAMAVRPAFRIGAILAL